MTESDTPRRGPGYSLNEERVRRQRRMRLGVQRHPRDGRGARNPHRLPLAGLETGANANAPIANQNPVTQIMDLATGASGCSTADALAGQNIKSESGTLVNKLMTLSFAVIFFVTGACLFYKPAADNLIRVWEAVRGQDVDENYKHVHG